MFIAAGGAAVVGIVVIGGDDHNDHSNHSRHNQYGDAALVRQIEETDYRIKQQESEIENYIEEMNKEFESKIAELKGANEYAEVFEDFDYEYTYRYNEILEDIKKYMKEDIEKEIQSETAELDHINEVIRRINELELNAIKTGGAK